MIVRERLQLGEWVDRAACRSLGPGRFFPDAGDEEGSMALARSTCGGCPVRVDCLEYALVTNEEHGTWGGTSARERRRIRRARAMKGDGSRRVIVHGERSSLVQCQAANGGTACPACRDAAARLTGPRAQRGPA